jgi:cathepsin A (carboxypeptidase C)
MKSILSLLAVSLLLAGTFAISISSTGTLREVGSGWKACDPSVSQWSGYFDVPASRTQGLKHYFYWAFGPRNQNMSAPVILWMTGGPGCSSSLALLAENGPCHMNETSGDLYSNPYGWNNDAFLIYIDQPAGVGFSYTDNMTGYDTDEAEVSRDMYWFLQNFLAAHPSLVANEFFVVGESYGGHFAPATAQRILAGNKANEGKIHINLQGLAVGNGLTNPYIQYAAYPALAYGWCDHQLGHPCVSKATYESMLGEVPGCQALIASCMQNSSLSCDVARLACNGILAQFEMTGLNVYDIRKPCNGQLCYNFDDATAFMNRADVQKALGVPSQTQWQACDMLVNTMFVQDWFKDFNWTIPQLLENDIRVLIYAGDMDFICNWIGNKNWTTALQWSKQAEFAAAKDEPFVVNSAPAAEVRSVGSRSTGILFSFMRVFGAGHMVPMDQPATALAMINSFITNHKFSKK